MRDPFQLELPIKLQPQDEAFLCGLKKGFQRGQIRTYQVPVEMTKFDLNAALQEFQKVH